MTNLWIKHMRKACKIFANILIATHLKIIAKRQESYKKYSNSSNRYFSTAFTDFQGLMQFFQASVKFNDFSRQDLNFMTFPGLYEPRFNLLPYNFDKLLLQPTRRCVMVVAIVVSNSDFIIMIGCLRSKYNIGNQHTYLVYIHFDVFRKNLPS